MTDLTQDMRDQLIRGYQGFRSSGYGEQADLYEDLGTNGQFPKVMMISCSDSRVEPSDIFKAYPGELFVVRNVANMVPRADLDTPTPSAGAALEFAVTVLGVKAIVVMGHASCGGVKGCMDGITEGFVGTWVQHLAPARERVKARDLPEAEALYELELEGVRHSLENLMTFDFIAERVNSGELVLQGAHFSIKDATLRLMDKDGSFEVVADA